MNETRRLTVCLDLDDTLIPNSYKYHAPAWRCGLLICETLGVKSVNPMDVLKLHYETDIGLVKERGFGTDRYPAGWVKTYEILAERAGLPLDRRISAQLAAIAATFQDGPFTPFRGAKTALARLRRDGHSLHLITAGDEGLQRRKVRESGLEDRFDSINVTGLDKKVVMAGIVGDSPGSALMVGDSKKSDLQPAIELGMTAVWIPSQTWSFAQTELDPRTFHTIGSIKELPDLIRTLVEGGARIRGA